MWGRRDKNVLRCQAQGHDDNTAPDGCPRLLENRPTGVQPAATRAGNVQQSRWRWPETKQADHWCREEPLRQSQLLLSALFGGFNSLLRNTNNTEIVFAFLFVFASSFISDSFLNLDGAAITKVPLTVPWCPLFPPKTSQVTGSSLSFKGPWTPVPAFLPETLDRCAFLQPQGGARHLHVRSLQQMKALFSFLEVPMPTDL